MRKLKGITRLSIQVWNYPVLDLGAVLVPVLPILELASMPIPQVSMNCNKKGRLAQRQVSCMRMQLLSFDGNANSLEALALFIL